PGSGAPPEGGIGPRLVVERSGEPPGGGTGAVGEAGTAAGAGGGDRRLFGRTPQATVDAISAASAARLETDPELGTKRLRDGGGARRADVGAVVVVLEPVEREEDAVSELGVEAVVGLVPHAGVHLEAELGAGPGRRARGLERLRVDERAEDAERVVEGIGDPRLHVEGIGDAPDDLPPEDEVDPVVLVEAEVPNVGVLARRIGGGRRGGAAALPVLGALVVSPLRAGRRPGWGGPGCSGGQVFVGEQ